MILIAEIMQRIETVRRVFDADPIMQEIRGGEKIPLPRSKAVRRTGL